MHVPPRVTQWVENNYKRPRVDPEWLSDCYDWLTTQAGHDPDKDFQKLVDAIEYQILESSFRDSMVPGTGLPANATATTTSTVLEGMQVLVEIASITEMGHSAFNLNQVRLAREERIKEGTVEDGEGEGDIDVAGEGPMPKYPRGTLKFELTDGVTILPAMEYRPLPMLSLENTPLGFKMILKDVRIHRGLAYLEPKCVVMIGHKTDDREDNRAADFARGLRTRMGLPEPDPTDENDAAPVPNTHPQPTPPAPAVIRSPLRDISPPPSPPVMYQSNDDGDLENRRRRVPNRHPEPDLSTPIERVIRPPPSRSIATTSSYFSNSIASGSGSSSSQTLVDSTAPMMSVSPTLYETRRPLNIASPPPSPRPEDESFWSDDHEDENQRASLSGEQAFIRDFGNSAMKFLAELYTVKNSGVTTSTSTRTSTKTTSSASNRKNYGTRTHTTRNSTTIIATDNAGALDKGKKKAGFSISSSDEFDDDIEFDMDMLAGLDAIEATMNATDDLTAPPTSTVAISSSVGDASTQSFMNRATVLRASAEVITIEDDSDQENKENLRVPTRHVRRRVDSVGAGLTTTQAPSMPMASQRMRNPGRPAILARNASDVIDLSDSE